jgi:2-hydroxy-3-oxopropionate reductase
VNECICRHVCRRPTSTKTSTNKEVAEQSEVVIFILPSSKETKEVVFGKNGLLSGLKKGQIVIDMSTSNLTETTKIMKVLKKKRVSMMDAPVSRGQKVAVNGTLSILSLF